MKTFLTLAAAVIALGLTAVKLNSPADTGKPQVVAQESPAENQGLARLTRRD